MTRRPPLSPQGLPLVSLADAARAFGRDPSAFRHAARAGRIPVWRIGRLNLTTMDAAADYVATQQPGHHPHPVKGGTPDRSARP